MQFLWLEDFSICYRVLLKDCVPSLAHKVLYFEHEKTFVIKLIQFRNFLGQFQGVFRALPLHWSMEPTIPPPFKLTCECPALGPSTSAVWRQLKISLHQSYNCCAPKFTAISPRKSAAANNRLWHLKTSYTFNWIQYKKKNPNKSILKLTVVNSNQ